MIKSVAEWISYFPANSIILRKTFHKSLYTFSKGGETEIKFHLENYLTLLSKLRWRHRSENATKLMLHTLHRSVMEYSAKK